MGVSLAVVKKWETGTQKPPTHVTESLKIISEMASEKSKKDGNSRGAENNKSGKKKKAVKLPKEAQTSDASDLIKSKKRVADHGEVFTPPWLVEKMLDLVKGRNRAYRLPFLGARLRER